MNNNGIITLALPTLGEEEKQAICDVLQSGWITMGNRVRSFEDAFASLHGVENAVAVNSCTAGLHLSLAALGIKPGDKVLAPSLSFVATVNAILYVGATPVFVDIEGISSPHISIVDAECRYNRDVKAVIVMHYGGYIVDLPRWRAFADTHGISLIEDAAHAPATKGVGHLSDAAAFSFFTNKNMTTSEGGMVISRDPAVTERIRNKRSHGMTSGTLERDRGHAYSYDVTTLGYNYRMDEMRAAMGLVQLDKLLEWNRKRRLLSEYYRRCIKKTIPEITVPFQKDHETSSHIMPVILPEKVDRRTIIKYLREKGIQTSIHYPPIHRFSYYQKRFPGVALTVTEAFCARELTLPLHPGLAEEDIDRIIQSLKEALFR